MCCCSAPEDMQHSPAVAATMTNGHVHNSSVNSGRSYTVSIAVPGSVIDNTQTMEAATAVAGQIARTAAIFNVDEVVVIDDAPKQDSGTIGAGAAFLARVLQFMETPQYLRRYLPQRHPQTDTSLSFVQSTQCIPAISFSALQ